MRMLLGIWIVSMVSMAGCTSRPEFHEPNWIDVADAETHAGLAREVARGWAADAVLFGIGGTEGVRVYQEKAPNALDTTRDPVVGDGLALAWTYAFWSDSRSQTWAAAISGNGTVLWNGTMESNARWGAVDHTPLEQFIGSAAAVRIARENASVGDAKSSGMTVLRMHLETVAGKAKWIISLPDPRSKPVEVPANGSAGSGLDFESNAQH